MIIRNSGIALDSTVKLALPMNGPNNSTFFEDISQTHLTITPTGSKNSSDHTIFGQNMGYFNGSSDYLTVSDHTNFNFLHTGSTSWSFRTYLYLSSLSDYVAIFNTLGTTSAAHGVEFALMANGSLRIAFSPGDSQDAHLSITYLTSVLTTSTLYYLVINFDHSTKIVSVYANGSLKGTIDLSSWYSSYGSGDCYQALVGSPNGTTVFIHGYLADLVIKTTLADTQPPTRRII